MIEYLTLGGTLFIPASHKSLHAIVNEGKYSSLRSVVIDFEDGLDESLFDEAHINLKYILKNFVKNDVVVFIRALEDTHLKSLLRFENIDKIDGFLLAKFSLKNASSYLNALNKRDFFIMPSIEGEELFDLSKLVELKDILLTNKRKIVLVRYGLEDMLKQLKIRRSKGVCVFDISATSFVLGAFIATFKSAGFAISAGVYPYFKDEKGFVLDLERDLLEGLFSKTIIHPSQIEPCNEVYKVRQEQLDEALAITKSKTAIFSINSKMIEPKTMTPYAKEIIKRSKIYGIISE